jgi:hypothetical protein
MPKEQRDGFFNGWKADDNKLIDRGVIAIRD